MLKKLIIILLILTSLIQGTAFSHPDRKSVKNPAQDTSQHKELQELAGQSLSYIMTSTDSALLYANQLLDLSTKRTDAYWQGRGLNLLGIIHQITGNYTFADSVYQEALARFMDLDSMSWVANVYNNLGLLQTARGRFDLAIISYFKSLQIRKDKNNQIGIAGALNKIGKAYCDLGDLAKAEEYYQEALEIHQRLENKDDHPSLLLNYGLCKIKQGDLDTGQLFITQADSILHTTHNALGMGELHSVKGEIFKTQNLTDEAINEYQQALGYYEKIGHKREIARVQLSMAELLYDKNQIEGAIKMLDTVLMTSYILGATDLELQALMFQAFLRAQLGQNYNRAILYKRYIKLSDSLYAVKQMEDLAKAENKYLVEQKERELLEASQRQKISDIKIKRNRMLAAIFAVLVFAVVVYSVIINRNTRTIKRLNLELKRHQEDLESEVQQRTKELSEAIDKVVQSDKLKSYFLANLSHEIRTPLNSILGFSDVLNDLLEPENRRFVEHITKSGEELLEIIDRILQLSKFQAGDIKALSGVFEPRSRLLALEKEVHKIQQEIGSNIKIELDITLDQAAPVLINSDPELIAQVILNLLHNSAKFTEKGKITYGMIVMDGEIEFFVQDTGIGIHEDDLPKVFTPFDQVEDVMTKTHRGIGLGLPLSAQIITLLNSQLVVSSEPGKGSRFSFRFPVYHESPQ